MRKVLMALGLLTIAVVTNHSLKTYKENKGSSLIGDILSGTTTEGAEEGSRAISNAKSGDLKKGSKKLSKTAKAKDSKSLKASKKKRNKKLVKASRKKNNRKKKKVNDNPFQANFDHLPDYTVYNGDSDFQEEMKDPGSL